jgi:hypothetical protein
MYFKPMMQYAFFNVLYTLCNLMLVIYKLIFDRINLSDCLSVCLKEQMNGKHILHNLKYNNALI